MQRTKLLLLRYDDSCKNGALHVSGWAPRTRTIEPVGEAYEKIKMTRWVYSMSNANKSKMTNKEKLMLDRWRERLGIKEGESYSDMQETNNDDDDASAGKNENLEEESEIDLTIDLEMVVDHETSDLYALMGLAKLRWSASQDQIKRAYRLKSLRHHPDKHGGDDRYFKALGKANDILSDPEKRKLYDSKDEFDDAIPSPDDDGDFYELYRDCFHRNARWSVEKPVPDLGDESTPYEKVEAFYQFWFNFKSWRVFSSDDDQDPDQGENRYEKRWIERQNNIERKKKKAAELSRINMLIEQSYRKDPRIARMKQAEKDAKEAKKNERLEKKRQEERKLQEEAERLRLEEERKKQEQEELAKEEKKKKEAEKNILRKLRSKLRASVTPHWTDKLGLQLEKLCLDASVGDLSYCNDVIEYEVTQNGADPKQTVIATVQLIYDRVTRPDYKSQPALISPMSTPTMESKSIPTPSSSSPSSPVTPSKTVPASSTATASATATSSSSSSSSSSSAVNGKSVTTNSDTWTDAELSELARATSKYPSGTPQRLEVITRVFGGTKTVDQVANMMKEMKKNPSMLLPGSTKTPVSSSTSTPSTPTSTSATATAAAATATSAGAKAPSGNEGEKTPAPATATSSSSSSSTSAGGEWTKEQQAALENGLVKYPASLGDSRWEKIAEGVTGKSKDQCHARFLHLKEIVKQKKQQK